MLIYINWAISRLSMQLLLFIKDCIIGRHTQILFDMQPRNVMMLGYCLLLGNGGEYV
jgi:hypothetical protein